MSVSTQRSKRQFRSTNVRKAFRPGRAKANIEQRRAMHYKFVTGGLDFRTRTKGTEAQIGTKFPVGPLSKSQLPKIRFGKHAPMKAHMTPLEIDAMKYERALEDAGFKGFTIGIKLKSGEIKEFPLISKSWHEAFQVAHNYMQKYDPNEIDEITIVDPSLHEIAHVIAGGAHRFAGAIKRGVEKIPGYAKRGLAIARKAKAEAVKGAHLAGRVVAAPSEVYEAYKAGVTERPETPGPEISLEPAEYAEKKQYRKPSGAEIASETRAKIARDKLAQARAEEELAKIEERKRLLRR